MHFQTIAWFPTLRPSVESPNSLPEKRRKSTYKDNTDRQKLFSDYAYVQFIETANGMAAKIVLNIPRGALH